MYTTKEKKHYKFTLYELEYIYREEKFISDNKFLGYYYTYSKGKYYKDRVNESCYKKLFSLDFNDEISLLKFLRNRYKKDNSLIFYTSLGKAIKGDVSNFSNYMAIISGGSDEEKVAFKLRDRKVVRPNYRKKKRNYTDYYLKSYNEFARQLKKKTIKNDEHKLNSYE